MRNWMLRLMLVVFAFVAVSGVAEAQKKAKKTHDTEAVLYGSEESSTALIHIGRNEKYYRSKGFKHEYVVTGDEQIDWIRGQNDGVLFKDRDHEHTFAKGTVVLLKDDMKTGVVIKTVVKGKDPCYNDFEFEEEVETTFGKDDELEPDDEDERPEPKQTRQKVVYKQNNYYGCRECPKSKQAPCIESDVKFGTSKKERWLGGLKEKGISAGIGGFGSAGASNRNRGRNGVYGAIGSGGLHTITHAANPNEDIADVTLTYPDGVVETNRIKRGQKITADGGVIITWQGDNVDVKVPDCEKSRYRPKKGKNVTPIIYGERGSKSSSREKVDQRDNENDGDDGGSHAPNIRREVNRALSNGRRSVVQKMN